MKLITEPTIEKGKVTNKPSPYNPSKEVKERMQLIMADFQIGNIVMNKPYEEFGNKTLVAFQNSLQKRFNNNIPLTSNDSNQNWRANTIRPLTRNKVISIVAHLTGSVLYPNIIAQNENSIEDKEMGIVMRDCIEWACEQSKYEDMFVGACLDMCINPAIIIYQDYFEIKRKIKEIIKKGEWKEKEIIDEVWSGFYNQIVPCDELYISNFYENDIQKQDFLIRVKNIPYYTAKAKYGDNPNFKYVEPGIKVFLNVNDGNYYQESDDELEGRLVQEVTYYNRMADLEIRLINGIMMDVPDRPMQRKDKKYPFSKSGYELFNSRAFYYMPLVAKLLPEQDVIDTLYNMIIDGTFLKLMPPLAIYGKDKIDSSIMMPGRSITFAQSTKVEAINAGSDLNAGLVLLQKVESSVAESSQDPLQSGQQMAGDRTKYEVIRLEQNARTILGLTGKMIARLVRDFGQLLTSSIVQYLPVADIREIIGDDIQLKFPSIFISNRNVKGKVKNRKIEFTTEMPQTEEEEYNASFDILKQEDKTGMSILKVNPDSFRKMKYLVKIEPEFNDNTTKFYKKLQIYDRLIQNPLVNQEASLRDFLLNAYVPGKEDQYIAKNQGGIMNQITNQINNPNQQFVNKTVTQSPNAEEI
jgi:hypothetical protein